MTWSTESLSLEKSPLLPGFHLRIAISCFKWCCQKKAGSSKTWTNMKCTESSETPQSNTTSDKVWRILRKGMSSTQMTFRMKILRSSPATSASHSTTNSKLKMHLWIIQGRIFLCKWTRWMTGTAIASKATASSVAQSNRDTTRWLLTHGAPEHPSIQKFTHSSLGEVWEYKNLRNSCAPDTSTATAATT